jgi:HPt (histidine-containing phosphotransfer) domain-containing protein
MNNEVVVYVDPDLEELIPMFIDNRYQDIEQINQLLSAGDFSEVQRLGHSMKGSGGGYGFDEITNIGSRMELAAIRGDRKEVEQLNKQLAQYLSNVKVVYHQ